MAYVPTSTSNPFWWRAEDKDSAWQDVIGYVRNVEEQQNHQHLLNLRNARLYSNADMLGLDWTLTEYNPSRRRISRVVENVIKSVCDTAESIIAKNRPKAAFMTDGADWSLQKRAQKLEQFMEGQFHLMNIYGEGTKVFRDAIVFGTGCMKVFIDHKERKVKAERVMIDEILVDEREARASYPRQLHQRRLVSREVLKNEFPEFAEQIEYAGQGIQQRGYVAAWNITDPDNVWVVESWHLNSGPGSTDGKHAITIDGATLLWEDFTEKNFPFVFYRWSKPLVGFYGQGLAEELTGIQLRINKLNNFIQRAQDLISAPRIFVDVANRSLPMQLNNEVGAIISYRGKPPVFMTPNAVGPEIYSYKRELRNLAFEQAGISQMSASSLKPAGLESAVALREFNDIETQRFAIQAQEYEKMYMEVAERVIKLSKELYAGGYNAQSVWRSTNYAKKINWNEVDLEETVYTMSIEASSMLSRTPAGRTQQVIELAQGGLIDRDEARLLLQHPDIKSSLDMMNSMLEDIDFTIEKLEEGEYRPPEPFQNLALGMSRIQMALLKAERDGAPEEILDGMRQWIQQAKSTLDQIAMQDQEQAAQAQMQAAMAAQGGAVAGTGVGPGGPALSPQAMTLRSA